MSTIEEQIKILTDIDEMVIEEDEKTINYESIDFILQNLRLAHEDVFTDDSHVLSSRRILSQTIVSQMCFYVGCILKPFTIRRRVPMIVVFGGEGYVGSQVVSKLIEFGLAPYLIIFSRGMLNANHWIEMGIKVVSTLSPLTDKDGKIDLVVNCTDLGAFPFVCQMLNPVINEGTAFITSTLGLQRTRVFNYLKTSCVLRTFQEHTDAIKKSINSEKIAEFFRVTKDMRDSAVLSIPPESDFVGSNLSVEEYAADLIARRSSDIRHLIFVIENNYVVKGLTPSKARDFAIRMILGDVAMEGMELPVSVPTLKRTDDMIGIRNAIERMREPIMEPFQRQLSKYIRVMDLPDLLELAVKVDAPEPKVVDNLFLNLQLVHSHDEGSRVSRETPEIEFHELLESDDGSVNSVSIRSGATGLDSKGDPLNNRSSRRVVSKLAEKQKEKEEARRGLENLHLEIQKRKMALEAQRKLLNDDMYNNVHPPMHSEQLISRIYDEDSRGEGAVIGLPPKVQALMQEMDEEDAFDINGVDDILEAYEGIVMLPSLTSLSLIDADLSEAAGAQFVSTMKSMDDGDEAMSPVTNSGSPSKHRELKKNPNSKDVLVDPGSHRGFVSVLHDRVVEKLITFELQGGIEVVHEGLPDPVEDELDMDDEDTHRSSGEVSRRSSGREQLTGRASRKTIVQVSTSKGQSVEVAPSPVVPNTPTSSRPSVNARLSKRSIKLASKA